MKDGLLGKKMGMTRVYDEKGQAHPVTVIHVAGNQVIQIKTPEKDGYSAVQVGYEDVRESRTSKPLLGHVKKHSATPKRIIREFQYQEIPSQGTILPITKFSPGDYVDVIGVTKGRGFMGVVRRYRFAGQPASHGSMMHRRTGSLGCRLTPGRIFKNKRMPGHMGTDRRTTQNLKVMQVRQEDGVILVRGSVPGANGSFLIVRRSIKKKAATAK
jgi:large subunit ribosomal protein L3